MECLKTLNMLQTKQIMKLKDKKSRINHFSFSTYSTASSKNFNSFLYFTYFKFVSLRPLILAKSDNYQKKFHCLRLIDQRIPLKKSWLFNRFLFSDTFSFYYIYYEIKVVKRYFANFPLTNPQTKSETSCNSSQDQRSQVSMGCIN